MVRTFQLISSTAIAPTTHEPARPTGRITNRDCPNLRVSNVRTSIETVRLMAVELMIDEISPERTFESSTRSPTTYALPPVSTEIIAASTSSSFTISSTIALVSASTSTLILR